jgi:hypothetical protein
LQKAKKKRVTSFSRIAKEGGSKIKKNVKRKYRKKLKKDESSSSVQITNQLYNAEERNVNGYKG